MSTTTATSTVTPEDLETRAVLDTIVERRRAADQAEADVLGLAVEYARVHPATDDDDAAWACQPRPLIGPPTTAPMAGAGTDTALPGVAEQAVVSLGAALGVSYRAALGLVGDAVELHDRLPRLWDLVQTGRLQAWKARLVTQHTRSLSAVAVAFVDRHVSVTARRNRLPKNLPALVHEAIAQSDPDLAEGIEEAALTDRDVTFTHPESTAVTRMFATLDTLDAIDLDNRISQIATTMSRLGDTSPLGVRRAHALGMLAGHGQQPVLDLHSDRPASTSVSTLYLHIDAADLEAGGGSGTGTVEKLGAVTLGRLRDWLQRVEGVTIRPVLDPGRTDPVDRHDPPEWMRETVILRDGHCVFPGCSIDARACDLDHIEPYHSPDDGGPPGQTSTGNLACLCRRHHRTKTHHGWTYHPTTTGYTWTSPHGLTYLTHPTPKQ